jgi:hypothetical protein
MRTALLQASNCGNAVVVDFPQFAQIEIEHAPKTQTRLFRDRHVSASKLPFNVNDGLRSASLGWSVVNITPTIRR